MQIAGHDSGEPCAGHAEKEDIFKTSDKVRHLNYCHWKNCRGGAETGLGRETVMKIRCHVRRLHGVYLFIDYLANHCLYVIYAVIKELHPGLFLSFEALPVLNQLIFLACCTGKYSCVYSWCILSELM